MDNVKKVLMKSDNANKIIRIYFMDFDEESKATHPDVEIFKYKTITDDDIIKKLSPKIVKKQSGRFIKMMYRNLISIKSEKSDSYFTMNNKVLDICTNMLISSIDIKYMDKDCFPCLSKYNNTTDATVTFYDYEGVTVTCSNNRCHVEFVNKHPKKIIKTLDMIYNLLFSQQ
jgi:hypothetical protein